MNENENTELRTTQNDMSRMIEENLPFFDES